jgi:hypothetical protein
MPVQLNIPLVASQLDSVPLAQTPYKIDYSYNQRDNAGEGRWRISLYNAFGVLIIGGIKIFEPQRLLEGYILDGFEGELEVVRNNNSNRPLGFDNFGIDKDYSLLYWSKQELEERGVT